MSSSAKLVIAASLVGASVIAAAELTRRSRDRADEEPLPVVASTQAHHGDALPQPAPRETTAARDEPAVSYGVIAERNIFRPLVSPPRGPEDVEPPSVLVPGDAAERMPRPAVGPTARREPPDPVADLALTGVTQVGKRLRALLEKTSTRMGRYVSVGDECYGFQVMQIGANSVVLEKDKQQYTLELGSKQFSTAAAAGPAASAEKPETAEQATPQPPSPSGRSRGIAEGFGSEMLAWAASMTLPDLERLYSQYRDHMQPEQRAQAEEYIERRRARGE